MSLKVGSTFLTHRGDSGRVVSIDAVPGSNQVIAIVVQSSGSRIAVIYTIDGKYYADGRSSPEDIAYSPDLPMSPSALKMSSLKIDDKVECSNDGKNWFKRHFAGIAANGRGTVFTLGRTSFTSEDTAEYLLIRPPHDTTYV